MPESPERSKIIVMNFKDRRVAVLREQCSTYQGILASVRSAFKSLKDVPVEEIVILSNYPSCWLNVEYSEATWEHAWAFVSSVTVVLKADREALENE